jgi:predicted phosphodiesterase
MSHSLRILHISDYHEKSKQEIFEKTRRISVFGDEWKKNVEKIHEDCEKKHTPIDLVCFTGDLAFSGKEEEYAGAGTFLDDLLVKLQVSRERFFVVPGNHDVDRDVNSDVWKKFRSQLRRADADDVSKWLAGKSAPLGFETAEADQIIERQQAYRDWLKRFKRADLLPNSNTHPRLGYRQTVRIERLPFPIHVIGLDSAWLAGDDKDVKNLRLTTDQIKTLAINTEGPTEFLPGFRLALIHHPLSELHDGSDCRRELGKYTDVLLHGHQHEPTLSLTSDPDQKLLEFAAGCLYQHDRYPNSHHLIDITFDDAGRPLQYDLWFRGWSRNGFWQNQNDLYRNTNDGRLTWTVQELCKERPDLAHP